MKVLVVTNMYPTSEHPFYGIFVKEQVESLRKEGVLVNVFFINGRENRLNYFTSIIGLSKKLRSNHYDIVHAHHTYCIYPLLFSKRILKKRRCPLVLTFHEAEVHLLLKSMPRDGDIIKKLVCLNWPKRIALGKVDLVITVEKALVEELGFKGRSVILPCGVDLDLFQPKDKAWCRRKLTLPIDKKIIFFPAPPNVKGRKGFSVVQDALRLVHENDLMFVTGGNIAHEDMPDYMCAADVVVHPSRAEASPMVIKEAMACSVPIVSTDVGDVKKVIGDSEGCYICERNPQDVAEKIETALEFNAGTKGRDRIFALGLGLHQISTKIVEIYEELLKTPQREKDD